MTHAILSILAATILPVQDKITLKFVPKAGQSVTIEETTEYTLKANAGGQEFEFSGKASEKTVTTFVKVEAGKVVEKLLHFEESVEEAKLPGSEDFTRNESPLHGRKITLTSKDGKVESKGAEDVTEDRYAQRIKIDEYYQYLLPEQPTAVGQSWEIKGDVLKKIMRSDEIAQGKISCTLREIKEVEKRKCAVIHSKWEVSGTSSQGFELGMEVEGNLVIGLENGIPLSMKTEGNLKVSAAGQFEGEGPITIERKFTTKNP
jgi:hypothetical protein